MRVPVSWLYDHVDLSLTPEELADVLTLGGLEVDAIHRPPPLPSGTHASSSADGSVKGK